MKKIFYSILAVAFLTVLVIFIRGKYNDATMQKTTFEETSVENQEISSESLSPEMQKNIYDSYLKQTAGNMLSDDFKSKNVYAYYDIGNDGSLDLIYGYKPDNSDEIRIRSFLGIVNGQVSTRYFLHNPDVDTFIPVIYSNGTIRNGGQYGGSNGSVCEQYDYYRFSGNQLCHYMILSYLAPPASVAEEWYICHIDRNYGKTAEKVTREEYDRIKAEAEAEPVNSELEWRSFADLG